MIKQKRTPYLNTGWESKKGGLRLLSLALLGLYVSELIGLVYGHHLTLVRFLIPTCIIGVPALLLYLGWSKNGRRGSSGDTTAT